MMLKDRCVAESRGDRGQLSLLRTLFVDKAMQADQEIREAILQYQDVLPSKLRALAQTTISRLETERTLDDVSGSLREWSLEGPFR